MIGNWITLFFDLYLTLYGDPDVAAVATAATINHLLATDPTQWCTFS